jgi:F-type H+-transporting ATPase subunit b
VFLLWKFGWPQIKKAMEDRTARVRQQLDEAATAKAEAEATAVAIRQAKGDISAERARLLADADQQAERLLADGRARLEQEVVDLEAKAQSDLASAHTRVVAEVQEDVARLAGEAAERIVADALADRDLQRELVEQFIASVGATTP